jgi:diphthine-ammonia ligase
MEVVMAPRCVISWSGGKDSCLALMRVHPTTDVVAMLTMFDESGTRSRSHGLRPDILAAHAERLGLTLIAGSAAWPDYERAFVAALREAAAMGCTHAIFGDIYEDAHRQWTERVSAAAGLVAMQPLWGESTADLVREFLALGGQARLTTTRSAHLDESWLGEPLTLEAVDAFEQMGVDPCGERGEYHTVVTHCPLFSSPLTLIDGERVERGDCWAMDFTCPERAERVEGACPERSAPRGVDGC